MSEETDRQERARKAVSVFRAMQPGLTGFARALSGRRDVVVQLAEQGGSTDGKNIFFKPPIALGDMTPHSRGLCDKRDAETLVQLCAACKVREEVLIVIYHEIAHIAFGTFRQPTDAEKNQAVEAAIAEVGTKYAQRIREKVEKMPSYLKADHLTMSQIVSPFLPTLINAIEDARIDEKLFQARVGTRAMFDALNQTVFNEGYEDADGSRVRWTERTLNSQIIIGVFVLGCGYDYTGWFSPEVEKALGDEKLRKLTDEIADLRNVHGSYKLSFKILARLRELGFCLNPNEPQDEEEQDDEDQVSDGDGTSEEDSPSEDSSEGGSSGHEEDSSQEDSDSRGSGDSQGSDASGREDSGDDSDSGESSASKEAGDTEQSPDSGDPSRPESGDGEPEEDGSGQSGEGGSDKETDESEAESGGSESYGSQGGSSGGSERSGDEDEVEGLNDGEEGSSDREDEGSTDDKSGDDSGDGSGTDDSGADDSESDSGDPGDDLDAEVDPVDSGADEGKGGDQSTIDPSDPNYGTAEEAAEDLKAFSKHDIHHQPIKEAGSRKDEQAVMVAVVQGQYFETSSVNVCGVREFKYGDTLPNGLTPDGWAGDRHSYLYQHRAGIETDMTISETVLGPALLEMRRVLSDNERAAMERHLRSGKINQRVLGKRAWAGDDRLFQKKRLPGKKSYAVVLGIDISASTVGLNIALAKRAAMAQAELLSRMGVDFAIYAHSANSDDGYRSLWLDMYEIKAFDAPWSPKEREALEKISPDSENLDGHSIEFYRKLVERQSATDKIILYYSDGKMPAANHDEELEILEREIAYCKKHQITLMGVGIRTDSPRRHGLDTVQVNDDSDIVKVVRHLKNGLLHNR